MKARQHASKNKPVRSYRLLSGLLLALLLIVTVNGCARQAPVLPNGTTAPTPAALAMSSPQAAPLTPVAATPLLIEAEPPAPTPHATAATPQATTPAQGTDELLIATTSNIGPFDLQGSHCAMQLPLMLAPLLDTIEPRLLSPAVEQAPQEVRPALEYMLQNPTHVGLAIYEVGREAEGLYINADNALPLASVVKVLHLLAYAEAVQTGELDPAMIVPLTDIERYYLPNSDLGAHPRSVATLVEEGRVFGQPPSILLEDVPRMMMEFSSNAATDYLHMMLGQERIEATASAMGMQRHSAPCPFLGQFLLMGRRSDGLTPLLSLVEDPRQFSLDVMSLTEQYSSDRASSTFSRAWVDRDNRPSFEAQRFFSEHFNAHGSAREYANLMARIATNEVGSWEHSVLVRRYMEWPTHFPDNQQRLAWLGYKGGSLPGVLTVAYYAQPWDTVRPVVVALFFHELPNDVYRDWRRSLPHDELARWLLREREAISILRDLFS